MSNHSTLEQALERFTLIGGIGSEESNEACAMTLLSWLHDETWTDKPECAHPLLSRNVIRANDDSATTFEMRAALVRVGHEGVLDTWWIPTTVIVWAFGLTSADEQISHYERTLRALERVAEWKNNKQPVTLTGASLTGAYLTGASLAGAYLTGASLTDANLTGASLTGANLAGASLAGAYLTGASLTDANLTGASLADANLTGAYRPSDPPDGWVANAHGFLVRKQEGV